MDMNVVKYVFCTSPQCHFYSKIQNLQTQIAPYHKLNVIHLHACWHVTKQFGWYGPPISTYELSNSSRLSKGNRSEMYRTTLRAYFDWTGETRKLRHLQAVCYFQIRVVHRWKGSHWLVVNDIESVNYICIPSCNGLQTPVKFHYQTFNIT
jgi:hypothetical protein